MSGYTSFMVISAISIPSILRAKLTRLFWGVVRKLTGRTCVACAVHRVFSTRLHTFPFGVTFALLTPRQSRIRNGKEIPCSAINFDATPTDGTHV